MIPSPKEKFQLSQVKTANWAVVTANPIFDEACDIALLQMLHQQPATQELAAAMHLEIVGAQRFARILKTIHEAPDKETYQKTQSLNYQAGV